MSYQGSHLSPQEQAAAHHPHIGDGTPETAPQRDADEFVGESRSWLPTKKWWAALAGGVATVLASWIVTGEFDDVERGMVGTALTALVAAYFKSNDDTPAGIPRT
jgi:hypothetical protein